jgi:cell division protein FtsZ
MKRKPPKKPKKPLKKEKALKLPLNNENNGEVKKTKIRVIGIGGGGGTIVAEIASRMPRASFVVANTDSQALRTVGRKATIFQFGQDLTRGLGTGMNPELGFQAALSEKERIKKMLEGQDLCILVACLGGGTGSGAVPVFAKMAKKLGNLTYGIFTFPFKFEGERKLEIARESLRKVKGYLNAVSIIPNERVFQIIDKTIPLRQALSTVNKTLTDSLNGLIETIYEPGLINIDFADFRTILEGRGRLAYLNSVEVQRKNDTAKGLIVKALNSPLYPYSIKGAKGVLFNISGEKDLSLSDVNEMTKTISEMVNPEAKIIFGVSQAKKDSDLLKTTLLVTGCGMKLFPPKHRKKKKIVKEIKKILAPKPRKRRKRKPVPKPRKKVRKKVFRKKRRPVKPKALGGLFGGPSEEVVRKNALQVHKEAEEAEEKLLSQEKVWETPAFLRKKIEK